MNNIISQLGLQRSYSRFLGRIGLLFAGSAVLHLIVVIARGLDWSGPVSFRKPVTFAVSLGLMVWAMGWIMDRLPYRPRIGWMLALPIGIGSVVEAALITMQSWRGQASHFNLATPFDSGVFAGMGTSILIVSVGLFALTMWSLFETPRGLKAPIITGMALLLLGLGIGVALIQMGVAYWEANQAVPGELLVGEAGIAKFPHATSLHGIQVFIVAYSVAGRLGERLRNRVVALVVSGYSSLVAWSVVHTNFGRAPSDPTGLESLLLFIGLAALIGAGLTMLVGDRHRAQPTTLPA